MCHLVLLKNGSFGVAKLSHIREHQSLWDAKFMKPWSLGNAEFLQQSLWDAEFL